MKKVILSMAMAAAIFTGCQKTDFHVTDQQEWNKGAIIWDWELDSMATEVNGIRTVYRTNEIKELQDGDGITFKADGTGIRYQGKQHFSEAPQVDQIAFNWDMAPGETNIFRMYGAGQFDPTKPFNEVFLSVNETHQFLKLAVTGTTKFYSYYYHQRPQ